MSLNLELTALAGLADHEASGTWDLSASPHFPKTRVLDYRIWFLTGTLVTGTPSSLRSKHVTD